MGREWNDNLKEIGFSDSQSMEYEIVCFSVWFNAMKSTIEDLISLSKQHQTESPWGQVSILKWEFKIDRE